MMPKGTIIEEFDIDLFFRIIEKMTVFEGENIVATLLDGMESEVVIAYTDSVLNNNTPLQGATVKIVRSGSNLTCLTILDSFKFTRAESNGIFYFTNLVPGTYKLTISNTGYYTTTQMVTLSNTIELILEMGTLLVKLNIQ